MTPKRIAQLEQMVERGTVSKGHILEMLDAIKQRTWVGLTDEERNVINRHNVYVSDLIGATEAKLKEKNT